MGRNNEDFVRKTILSAFLSNRAKKRLHLPKKDVEIWGTNSMRKSLLVMDDGGQLRIMATIL